MKREQFPLSSEQLELLLAFETASSLTELSELMAKDPSVISRNLQRLAEDYPVLTKLRGRWMITPLGQEINVQTKSYLAHFPKNLSTKGSSSSKNQIPSNTPLIIINAQMGLLDPLMGARNNDEAETNILKLLSYWRSNQKPIIHVKHVSENTKSMFYKNSKGVEFIPSLTPQKNEIIIEKSNSSAFTETNLKEYLESNGIDTLVLVGFTANECVDATARQASDLDFTTLVIDDATATFDISESNGKIIKADRIHRLIMANLNALFAKVMSTEQLLKSLN